MKESEKFLDKIKKIVYTYLDNEKLLRGQWHLGVVDSVVSPIQLKVFVDGSTTSQTIPCNPDITFNQGDHVYVHFVNNNTLDKFVPFKRGVNATSSTTTAKVIQLIHSTNITVTSAGLPLAFQTEVYKDDLYTHATNDTKVYVVKGGLYRVNYSVGWCGNATTHNINTSYIRKNGSTAVPGTESKSYTDYYNTTEYDTTGSTFLCPLNANDYIEVFCKTEGSAVLTTIANNTTLSIEFIK